MAGRRVVSAWIGVVTAVAVAMTPLAPVAAYAATSDVVSVRDHGAVGNGIADDTAAFKAALTAAAGKTLSIPAGTYRVGNLPVTKPVNVVGAGVGATVVRLKDAANDDVFDVKDTNNVDFSDLTIDGNRSANTTGHPCGIHYERTSDCLVQRVDVHDCDKGGVVAYEGSTRIVVRDSHFAYNENDVLFHKATYCKALNNVGEYTRTDSMATYEEAYGPQVTGHNEIAYNKVYHAETGTTIQRSHDSISHDNYVEDCKWGVIITGIRDDVYQNTYRNVAANNTIVGGPLSSGTAIANDSRSYDCTFSGNVVRDYPAVPGLPATVQIAGRNTVFVDNTFENIALQLEIGGDDIYFARNTIRNSAKQGLIVTKGVRNVRIENNLIENCGGVGMQMAGPLQDCALVGNTLHDNRAAADAGPGLWTTSASIWTNTVFANNTFTDDRAVQLQRGPTLRAGSVVAVAGNTIQGSSAWSVATAGATVDIGKPASDGHARWTCSAAGQPGTWVAADVAAPAPAPAPTPAPAPETGTSVTPPASTTTLTPPATTEPGTSVTPPATGTKGGRKVKRIAGADRYATAVAISSDSFTTADTVVLATGVEYPDALAASSLAGTLDAPLLLTNPTTVREDVFAEIGRLGAKKVVLVGGTAAVSGGVESALKARGLQVERIAGANRFATSGEVARRVTGGGKADTVFIARGDDFADALSVSPLAYAQRFPVLLTRTAALPADTEAALKAMGPAHVVIVGGTSAVGSGVEAALKALCPDVERVAGPTRYATSAAIARFAIGKGWATADGVGIAAGDRFPDALGGGAACGNANGLLLLTPPPALSGETRVVLSELMNANTTIELYGGVGAVFTTVETDVRALAL